VARYDDACPELHMLQQQSLLASHAAEATFPGATCATSSVKEEQEWAFTL
jgi:hypothetical protein